MCIKSIIRVNRGSRRQIYKLKQSTTILKLHLRQHTRNISRTRLNAATIQPANHTRPEHLTRRVCINVFGIVSISDTRLALHLALGREGDREIIRSSDRRERSIKRTKRLRRCRYRAISPHDDTRELTRGITSRGRRGWLVILATIYRQQQQQQQRRGRKGRRASPGPVSLRSSIEIPFYRTSSLSNLSLCLLLIKTCN